MNLLLEFLKDLLPNKDLPTGAWISRVVTLFVVIILSIQYLSSLLRDTTIAHNHGFIKVKQEINLSQVAFTRLVRKTRRELRRLIGNENSIKAALVIANYDATSGKFSTSNSSQSKIIVWEFASPENLFLSVNNLEIYLKGGSPELSAFATKRCIVSELSNETVELLSNSVNLENVTHWLKCPINLTGLDENISVAHSIAFFNMEELNKNNSSVDRLISNMWDVIESISDSYSYFDIPVIDSQD